MGTRGIVGFVVDGQVKATYNHFDSYPSGLGTDVLKFARGITDRATLAEQVKALVVVDQQDKPDAATLKRLIHLGYADPGVSTGDDWYSALRNTQGDLAAILGSGYFVDSGEFYNDSLFCEWGYLINLDEGSLEVYKGFQDKPHSVGRFGGKRKPSGWKPQYKGDKFWYPIKLVGSYSLSALPTDDLFVATFEREEEPANA